MDYEQISYERRGAAAVITIERPERMNAIGARAHRELVDAWGRPLDEGLRIEAECFNRLLSSPEILEGLRRFNERDHPDRDPGSAPATPGLPRL